jgi:hypothetical protein
MGLAHAARAEKWPVMPVSRAGFRLVPYDFFDRNPALDVRRRPDELTADGHARLLQNTRQALTLNLPSGESSRLEGLMSRWMTPFLWA